MKLSIQVKAKDLQNFYVYICIFHKGERVLIATNYIISAKYVKNGKITDIGKYAEIYNNELLRYQNLINQIPAIDVLSAKSIKEIITNADIDRSAEVVDFISFAQKHIKELSSTNRKGTANAYLSSLLSFKKFINRDTIYTFEITSNLLHQYIRELYSEGKSAKTINVYITHLRVLFNACRDTYNDYDLGVLLIKNYPFRKLLLPKTESEAGRKALSVADMQKFIELDVAEELQLAKDMFLLSFYLLGINMADLFNLKKADYKDGRIIYQRRKTIRRTGGSKISIPVSSYAESIIYKYIGRGNNLLNLCEKYKDAKSVNSCCSARMGVIYNLLAPEMEKKDFTMYSARHTWASIAANECHFSDAEVARALNHQSEHKVTRGYIRQDWSLLDRMNEEVMKIIFNKS